METIFAHTPVHESDVDVLAMFLADTTTLPAALVELDAHVGGTISREIERGRLRDGKGDAIAITGAATGPRQIVLVGLGATNDGEDEAIRTAGGRIAGIARQQRASHVGLVTPEGDDAAHTLGLLVEGYQLGAYRFHRHKSTPDDATDKAAEMLTHLTVYGRGDDALNDAAQRATTLARATNFARDLANAPGNLMTPELLAGEAERMAAQYEHMSCHYLDRAAIVGAGMGLLAAVAQGSENEPHLIVLEWNPPGDTRAAADRLALVGKAVTFDTGGISIKPSAGMTEMKMDKAGGCAVIAAMQAIADLDIQHRILAVVGATENMPGGRAYKPGDVVTAMDGTTVEITNTDAEGRLVLGDAISYARSLGCARIVEISTLTGAIVVALGHHYTGMIARASELTDLVSEAGAASGDLVWHLPMHDAYKPGLKSDCADMVNSGGRGGSSLYAGLFMEHFAKDTPFVHLDVAGTAMLPKADRYYQSKGASGVGVRLFVELAERS